MNQIKLPILFFCLFLVNIMSGQLGVELEEIASGLNAPVDIKHVGDDRLFVVERVGRIRIMDKNGTILPDPFLDIDPIVRDNSSTSEQGLLGLAFHPDYTTNGYFFIHYIDNAGNSQIVRYQASASNPNLANPATATPILSIDQPFNNHNGGDLAFGPDSYLYIPIGDGGSGGDPRNLAQNRQSLLGKILRIDIDNGLPYTIPADNPFADDDSTLDEIWAIGLRNPWRISFDRMTNDLWISDVGQALREEINFEAAGFVGGANYGWRCYEGDLTFNTADCAGASQYTAPLFDYDHQGRTHCSITGGYVYRGSTYPSLQGKYLYADFCSGQMWALFPDGNGGYMNESVGVFNNVDFTTFGEDDEGEMYVAGLVGGKIFRIKNQNCANLVIDFTVTNESCNGQSDGKIDMMVYSPEQPITYQWSTGATTEDLENIVGGTYAVTVTDAINCSFVGSIFVDNQSAVIIGISTTDSTTICAGETATLTATEAPNGYRYVWYKDQVEINGQNNQTLTVSEAGTYSMSYDSGPCPVNGFSNPITITVDQQPAAPMINTPGPFFLCNDATATLTSDAAPVRYSYQWFNGGVAIAGANGQTYNAAQSGQYYVTFEGACEPDPSNWITITKGGEIIPDVSALPDFCSGDIITASDLLPAVNNLSPDSTQFYIGLPLTVTNEIDVNGTELDVNNNLIYVVATTGGCLDTASFAISVVSSPDVPVIVANGNQLSVPADNTDYQWYLNGVEIDGATSNIYVASESGDYTVEVANSAGCLTRSDVLNFVINSLNEIGFDRSLRLDPNPGTTHSWLTYVGNTKEVMTLSLMSADGKKIWEEQVVVLPGWQKRIEMRDLAPGVYFLNAKTLTANAIKKLVKR